ncbi:hypothetical protein L1887_23609 [Cichorium endivia]|nr:hypothetical protein L1887_23609 [Cichorium endivia]
MKILPLELQHQQREKEVGEQELLLKHVWEEEIKEEVEEERVSSEDFVGHDTTPESLKCFRCGKQGHQAKDYNEED